MERRVKTIIKYTTLFLIASSFNQTTAAHAPTPPRQKTFAQHPIILFIWDGLRPDSITKQDTPTLYRLKHQGVWFSDHHATYPSFTMINAASFATGNLAGKTGFYGNVLWNPRVSGTDAQGHTQNFRAPIFTEDYKILKDLNHPEINDPLCYSHTLFSTAHQYGLNTAAIGKSGPAFMQNFEEEAGLKGIVLDENHVYPLEFAKTLVVEGYPIPKLSPYNYKIGVLKLGFDNGDPTKFAPVSTLKVISSGALGLEDDFMYPENVTSDPTATSESPYVDSNDYLMQTFLTKVLPQKHPKLSILWLRNPDTTEHNYGVGSASYHTALQHQDRLLKKLLEQLKALKLDKTTNLLIASDHSHSNTSGPLTQFPLRLIHNGILSVPDPHGFSVSGDFRPADLLTRAGFKAFDGKGCQYDPALSGIKENGQLLYPIKVDKTGRICGDTVSIRDAFGNHQTQSTGHLYTTPAYRIPAKLPDDAIVIANNGGSTYFYVLNHNHALVKKLVRYLQGRQEFGAIFADDRYTDIAGVLPQSTIKVKNLQNKNPDLIVSSNFDENATINTMRGTEFSSNAGNRGMHGSFSQVDIHNTLLAIGPDFKVKFIDPLPSANVDVPATIAYLLHLPLTDIDGRPLLEAFKKGVPFENYSVVKEVIRPHSPAAHLTYQLATDPDGKDVDPSKTHYTVNLEAKVLTLKNKSYTYFDRAVAKRY